MGDISDNFSRWEFICACGCGQSTIDVETITILEITREHFGYPIHINSGNRCLMYNRTLPDSLDTSQHIKSKAVDFRVESVPAEIVYNFLTMRFPNKYGFGRYRFFTHADSRLVKSRW